MTGPLSQDDLELRSQRRIEPALRLQHLMRRSSLFAAAVLGIAFGLAGVLGQHAAGPGIALAIGLLSLAVWWLTRTRYPSSPARQLGTACSLLTLAVTAAAVGSLALYLYSPADAVFLGSPAPATLAIVWPAIAAAAVFVLLLAARILAGRRLRALTKAGAVPTAHPQ